MKKINASKLSELLNFSRSMLMAVPPSDLEHILQQLEIFDKEQQRNITGTRPQKSKGSVSEAASGYRQKMTAYISENTGVIIPVRSTMSTNFYDKVADYLDLP